jgi:hypothetical protein
VVGLKFQSDKDPAWAGATATIAPILIAARVNRFSTIHLAVSIRNRAERITKVGSENWGDLI